jgi:GntR family transcriptional regulator
MDLSRDNEPTYALIARSLRAAILRGSYGGGLALPTEANLAEQFDVSRQTVRRAFQDLVAEGLVYRVPGRGTFARTGTEGYVRQVGSVDDLMGLGEDTSMEIRSPLARQVDVISAGRMRLSSDVVYNIGFVRHHDGVPFCTTNVWLPPFVGKALAGTKDFTTVGARSRLTVIEQIDAQLPHPIAEAQQSITAELATPEVARQLNCETRHPVLRIDRLYSDTDGNCVELAISHFLPEHYSYRINLLRGS